ncbi:unnamed protein product [Diamesa hyperborea]
MTSTAKVARWFNQQIQWNPPASLSRPESGFVSTSECRSERNLKKSDVDVVDHDEKNLFSSSCNNNSNDYADEYLLVEGTASLWSKLSIRKRKKLLGLKLGKVTTFYPRTKSFEESLIATPSNAYTLGSYLRDGCVHGIKYLGGNNKRSKAEKSLWFVILSIFAVILSVFVVNLNSMWASNVTVMSPGKPMAISNYPFPAVTFCSETKFNSSVLNFTEAYHTYNNNETRGSLSEDELTKLEVVTHVCDAHLMASHKIVEDPKSHEITKILKEVALPFDEQIMFCRFKNVMTPCEDLLTETVTDEGICYTFNMQEASEMYEKKAVGYSSDDKHPSSWNIDDGYKNDKYDNYPHRATGSAAIGLNIVLKQKNSDLDYICRGPVQGFKVHIHRNDEPPAMSSDYYRVGMSEETIIAIKSEVVNEIEDHECYDTNDHDLQFFEEYSQSKCELECLAKFMKQECGCVKFSLPHDAETKVCNQHQLQCYNDATTKYLIEESFKANYQCGCLPSCNHIEYTAEVSQTEFHFDKVISAYKQEDDEEIADAIMSRLVIYMKDTHVREVREIAINDKLSYYAQLGGLMAFFLGISLVSVVEVVYYIARGIMMKWI